MFLSHLKILTLRLVRPWPGSHLWLWDSLACIQFDFSEQKLNSVCRCRRKPTTYLHSLAIPVQIFVHSGTKQRSLVNLGFFLFLTKDDSSIQATTTPSLVAWRVNDLFNLWLASSQHSIFLTTLSVHNGRNYVDWVFFGKGFLPRNSPCRAVFLWKIANENKARWLENHSLPTCYVHKRNSKYKSCKVYWDLD